MVKFSQFREYPNHVSLILFHFADSSLHANRISCHKTILADLSLSQLILGQRAQPVFETARGDKLGGPKSADLRRTEISLCKLTPMGFEIVFIGI